MRETRTGTNAYASMCLGESWPMECHASECGQHLNEVGIKSTVHIESSARVIMAGWR